MRITERRMRNLEIKIRPKVTQDMINLAFKDLAELMRVVDTTTVIDINGNSYDRHVETYLTDERVKEICDILLN